MIGKKLQVSVAVLVLAGMASAADNELTPQEQGEGWQLLFDGTSYHGWVNSDLTMPRNKIQDGCINPHGAGSYMVLYDRQWSDYLLELDYKTGSDTCNSGVFSRANQFNLGSDFGWFAIEWQIWEEEHKDPIAGTGSFYCIAPGRLDAAKPVGQWNHLELTCSNNLLSSILNGIPCARLNLDEFNEPNKGPGGLSHKFDYPLKDLPRTGYIGLQDHGANVWFKNIKLKPLVNENELTAYERANGWVRLFDGKTMNGWLTSELSPPRNQVVSGSLNPHGCATGLLVHEQQWDNFILSCEFKTSSRNAASGIFLRLNPLQSQGHEIGYYGLEVPIDEAAPGMGYSATGSIRQLAAATMAAALPPGRWNHMEITCSENLVRVMLNGFQTAYMNLNEFTERCRRPDGTYEKVDYVLKDRPRVGYIGLRDRGSDVWFQNIKLKPLSAAKH